MLFFWPIKRNPNPGVFTFVGRAAYAVCLIYAAVITAIAVVSMGSYLMKAGGSSGLYWEDVSVAGSALTFTFALAFAICLLGRAIRFALGRE